MPANAEEKSSTADDAMAHIARLREQVETLMRDKVTPAVTDAANRVGAASQEAVEAVRSRAEVVAGSVREQPLTAILIAAAVGFIIGRATR